MSKKIINKYRTDSIRLKNWDYRNNAAYFITICAADRKHFFGECKDGKMELSRLGVIADVLWHDIPHRSPNVKLDAFVVMPNHIHGLIVLNNNTEFGPAQIEQTLHARSRQNAMGEENPRSRQNAMGEEDSRSRKNAMGEEDSRSRQNAMGEEDLRSRQNAMGEKDSRSRQNAMGEEDSRSRQNAMGEEDLRSRQNAMGEENAPSLEPGDPDFMGSISPKSNSISVLMRSYKSAVTKHANRLGLENGWQSRFYDRIIWDYEGFVRVAYYINHNPANWKEDSFKK